MTGKREKESTAPRKVSTSGTAAPLRFRKFTASKPAPARRGKCGYGRIARQECGPEGNRKHERGTKKRGGSGRGPCKGIRTETRRGQAVLDVWCFAAAAQLS